MTTKWDGQIGEVDVRSGKFRRVTNDLNTYSGQSLAMTKDAKQLVAIQSYARHWPVRNAFGAERRHSAAM